MFRKKWRLSIAVAALLPALVLVPVDAASAVPEPAALAAVTSVTPALGSTSGGTRVTVHGNALGRATQVLFGRVAGSGLDVLGPHRVVITAPAHRKGTYDVRVRTAAGLSRVVTADEFTYEYPPSVGSLSPVAGSAAGGDTVTVYGHHLGSAVAVLFGNTAGTQLRVIGPRQLTVTSPAHPGGTADVRVRTSAGMSQIVPSDQFTFEYPPSVSSVSPSSGDTAGGDTVTVHGFHLATAVAVLFGNTPGTQLQVIGPRQLTVTAPAHAAGTVDIEVQTAAGTSQPGAGTSFEYVTPSPPLTWSAPQGVDRLHYGNLGAVSCPSSGFCGAVDSDSALTETSGNWSQPTHLIDDAGNGLQAISCPAAGTCLALGYNAQGNSPTAYAAILAGGTWTTQTVPTLYGHVALSCVTSSYCWGIDYDADLLFYDGSTFTEHSEIESPEEGMQAISCVTSSFCAAVGDYGNVTIYNGTSWTPLQRLTGQPGLGSISCTSATFCMASTYDNQAYIYNGATWTKIAAFATASSGPTVSCFTPSSCIGVNPDGISATWDGSAWTPQPAVDMSVYALSCAAVTDCTVTGHDNTAHWDGSAWSAPEAIDYTEGDPNAISCPTIAFCAVSDATGAATFRQYGVWAHPVEVTPDAAPIRLMSCTSSTFCMALTSFSDEVTYNGSTWSAPAGTMTGPGSYADIQAFTCHSPTFCMALNDADYYSTYNGNTWTAPQHIAGNNGGFFSVSCPTTTWCTAISTSGQAFVYNNGQWSPPTQVSPDRLYSVSCPTTSFCATVGSDGTGHNQAYLYNDGTWTSTTMPNGNVQAVSCGAADECVAVDYSGDAYQWNGLRWVTSPSIDQTGDPLQGISCATAGRCATISSAGDAVTSQ